MDFLVQQSKRPFTTSLPSSFAAEGLFLSSNPDNSLEIGLISSNSKPSRQELTKAWKDRRGGRATPVLLIAVYGEFSSLCGPSGDNPAIMEDIDIGRAERLAAESLGQPDRLSAQRFLHDALPTLETKLPGITNEGMLALHNLTTTAKGRSDWSSAGANAQKAVKQSGQDLLQALGYSVEKLDNLTKVLRSADKRAALAVLLDESESIEGGSQRFNTMSPISYSMSKADEENLSWIIIVKGNRIRLYSTEVGKGVGRRGRTETYIECQPSLLADEDLGYLWMLFSAQALEDDGSLAALLTSSERFAGDLAERLRDRIYEEVVPHLAKGIVEARALAKPSRDDLDLTYQMALTVLFRLLFIAYAEDRDLLPYRQNEAYRKRSLTEKAKELAKAVAEGTDIGSGHHHWQECEALFSAVNVGNSEWSVPTYGGGLFSQDRQISPAGDALKGLSVSNEYFEMALRALLVTDAEGEPGAVDFRSLGVREFGTIYEGLLEAELSAAESDLMLDKKATYVPVVEGKKADVISGEVYLHNKSGARKSSGSYYTKSFAVEYLLDGALEPALDDHFAELDAMSSDVDAAEKFFDFRVADIAMGSGHFLVAAVDRIEARMANYLKKRQEEKRPLTLVQQDLNDLRNAAQKELGEIQEDFDIEDGQLLRRQIARRCIYGVDLNPLAVQLARLSIWIHTFVPGLPLSLLDHNLVRGNALVGVGTVDEIRDKFDQMGGTLFQVDADDLLGQAAKPLKRLANLKDATPADIEAGREAMQEARLATLETEALCDLITAQPISDDERVKDFAFENWEDEKGNIHASRELVQARKDLQGLHAFHFPVQFPEVFLGKNPGFNVILGNPPWQEATVEELAFYARHFPGLRGLSVREQKAQLVELKREHETLRLELQAEVDEAEKLRELLTAGLYPGMGTGDPDVYKAFCWRFWNLIAENSGRLSVVLPRSAVAAKGSELFRRHIFKYANNISLTMLLNRGNWVFKEVHPQYTFALMSLEKNNSVQTTLSLKGPYASPAEFADGLLRSFEVFPAKEIIKWNSTASLPLFPSQESIEVFRQLRKSPWLDDINETSWRSRADRELDATNDKHFFDLESEDCPEGYWPVFKGESFDIWTPDTGKYNGWAEPEAVKSRLYDKRLRSAKSSRPSAHSEFPKDYWTDRETLPCNRARVAFRDITNRTNQRTTIACLLPPNVFLTNKAPYLLFPKGTASDEAFLLGVMSSIPLDWYARRFVEINLNYFILNAFPIPRPSCEDPLWQRTVQLSGRLACPDERFKEWADEVGVDWGALDEGVKQDMIHELDAVVAHLYGLSADQLTHIFETFHEGWDYKPRLTEVMRHYEDCKNKK
jgi:hypothetical protein